MKIGFIGCGNMASAMISGMLKKGLYKKDEIIVSNLTEEGSKRSREKLGVVTTLDNHEVVKNTKLVFLAVKPQFYEEVLNEVKDELTPEHTVVGIILTTFRGCPHFSSNQARVFPGAMPTVCSGVSSSFTSFSTSS